jgi:uncharacterized protein YkwD
MTPTFVFHRVNVARRSRGVKPLRWDSRLAAIAKVRARKASRLDPGTHPPGTQLDRAMSGTWVDAGEALAWMFESRVDPVSLWLASPDHRALILDPRWTHGGVGFFRKAGLLTIALIVADRRP